MHHKLLDLGALTISDERQIWVSDRVHGYEGAGEWAVRYHGQPLSSPQDAADRPALAFLRWHRREVFKGEPRQRGR